MSTTYVETQNLSTITCYKCSVLFAIPDKMKQELLKNHENFWCPAGHQQHFVTETEEDRLKREVAQLQTRIEHKDAYEQELRDRNTKLTRSCSAVKGVVTRIKNRVGAGVCPCCNRTFQCLARHMDTKHPGYRKSEP